MNIENVIINLKVVSKLIKNQKINTYQSHLNIEQESIVPEAIRRWHRHDNRDIALNKINTSIDVAIEYDKKNLEQTYNIKKHLNESIQGLLNFKETYSLCSQTGSRIDLMIEKINTYTKNEESDSN
jgi:RNA polymerase-binding transcription factor DksA